ncbi:MAG: glycine dehydrogenase (aminomethyl-transferring) [Chloroflexi bacterium]|nr:glycine dehydrogenase (aminomethyl-transferring) [Chloroflexota bacterium]|tara:strand:- start:521 stop:1984 length:1464 start_codon:yes stop_codon:yes gene_type:complete
MNKISKRKLLFDQSITGKVGTTMPSMDIPAQKLPDSSQLREELTMPEVSENEIVRYFSSISQMNFSIDHNFYPLGSCTMKYNPKLNDDIAALPGFNDIHPLQDTSTTQGALELMHHLQILLAEITGMAGTSLAPMAGAEAELAGMLMIRAYHRNREDFQRKKVIIPDSAHGTNPASAVMAGFEVVSIPTDKNGNTDLDALRSVVDDTTAGLMLTQPSTIGLFDTNIVEIVNIINENGGLIYGDGANLNAILGKVKPGEIGFDVIHSNLHKTFTQPHGGGGPGAGAVMVSQRLVEFLPDPVVTKIKDNFDLTKPSKSIGKMGAFHGNFGALVRAYAYIRTLGKEGINSISEDAVINANYLRTKLENTLDLPYNRICSHEVVFSAKTIKEKYGVNALDISKRLIDYNIHPPTMYFPLIVDEALLVEPTETESKETLDDFIYVIKQIVDEAKTDPELLHNAPHNTPNKRLNEALAARNPKLSWRDTQLSS